MAAMWDRRATSVRPPPGRRSGRRRLAGGDSTAAAHDAWAGAAPSRRQPIRSTSGRLREEPPRDPWELDWNNSLNAFGISSEPPRYHIRGGKAVRLSADDPSPLSLNNIDDNDIPKLPLRNPRRLLRLNAGLNRSRQRGWLPPSPAYHDIDSDGTTPSPTSHFNLSSAEMHRRPDLEQISPPSSPDLGRVHDVSPMESDSESPLGSHTAAFSAAEGQASSQQLSFPAAAPQAKRAAQDGHVAPKNKSRLRDHQRLAVRSSLPQGRQMRPETSSNTEPNADGNPLLMGSTTTISGPQAYRSTPPASLSDRMRLLRRSKPEALENRPPWNGASGRTKVVSPIHDDPHVAPLNITSRGARSGHAKASSASAPLSPVSPRNPHLANATSSVARRLLPRKEYHAPSKAMPQQREPICQEENMATAYAYPPQEEPPIQHDESNTALARDLSQAATPAATPSPDPNKAIRRKPSPAVQVLTTPKGVKESPFPASDDGWVQPPSRFSITTYATSNSGTPPQPEEEPMPGFSPQPESMMNRKRPISSKHSSASPAQTSVPGPEDRRHEFVSHIRSSTVDDRILRRPESVLSTSKPLPPAPPELQSSNDRVAQMMAQLEGLAHRRINIHKSIKQMTELMPTDNLLASAAVIRKREDEKQKVEGLRDELAEIKREEYDLGLKLHRAHKRLDRDAEYEPTTLWVRRVTT